MLDIAEKLILRPESPLHQKAEDQVRIGAIVNLDLVCWWVRTDYGVPEKAQGRIVLISPAGKELIKQEYPISIDKEFTGWRPTIKLPRLPIGPGSGVYWFENQLLEEDGGWTTVARLPLELQIEDLSEEEIAKRPAGKVAKKTKKGITTS